MEFNLLNLDNRGKMPREDKIQWNKEGYRQASNFTHENKKQIRGAIRWNEHKEDESTRTDSVGEQKQRVKQNLKIK
jgi:hypothetical protein